MLHTGFPSPTKFQYHSRPPRTAPAPLDPTAPSDSLLSSVACLIPVLVSPCPALSLSVPVCPCPGLPVPVLVSPYLCPGLSPSVPVCPCPGLCPCSGLCLILSLASGSRLSGRLGRSESLRVSDRRRPSRGSLGAKGRGGGRSRSDVDMDPSSATAVLGPARRATYVTIPPIH